MVPKFLKGIHWPIFWVSVVMTGVGILEIYSASFRGGGDFAAKQWFWALMGVACFFAAVFIGYRTFLNLASLFYLLTLALLVWVLLFGHTRLGVQRWIDIGPLALQPSEFAKIATILLLSHFLAMRSPLIQHKRTLIMVMILASLPTLLILKQPDLGSALVFFPILIALVFNWGAKLRYFVFFFFFALASSPFLWHMLKPYQQKRLLVFLNPSIDPIGASYTAIQSKIAVGAGGLFGKGWLQGTQTQLDFVPEHHTDFIFSVIAEEFGFLGGLFVVLMFAVLIAYIFQIMQHTTDLRGRFLGIGIAALLFFQVFVNIGMTIGLAPITGITLPFLSYGGSSLASTFFAIGLLVSVYRERSIF